MEKLVPLTPLEAAVVLACLQMVLDAEVPTGNNLKACLAVKQKLATLFEVSDTLLSLVTRAADGRA